MTRYPHLFEPIRIGPLHVANRIMMGSMHTNLEGREDGAERLAAFYAARAEGGTGLIVTGGWAPNQAGRLSDKATAFVGDERIENHRIITDAVHRHDSRIVLQLVHGGRYCYHDAPVAPSAIRSPINRTEPRALEDEEIEQTINDFANAAARAMDVGYDGVEIMGSEGYLITQFLAPHTNHRDDRWGGSLENRTHFALEIIRRVRMAIGPERALIYRISAIDLIDNGLSREETVWLARECEQAGADALDTGIGWHEARVPTIAAAVPRAGFAFALEDIKATVSIPVIATNRINMPETAERIIAGGIADMVALARPMLADPAFAAKARAGADSHINTCIACNQACLDHYFEGRVVSCLVNPLAGFETLRVSAPAADSRSIAVVGAGPAGLTAAIGLAERGHRVTLYEAAAQIGGQFQLARRVPSKEEFAETIRYWSERVMAAGVAVRLGVRADTETLLGHHDETVLATGVMPRAGVIDGEDHAMVMTYAEALSGERPVGRRVVIIGAGGIGFDVALALTNKNNEAHRSPEAFCDHWGIGRPAANGRPAPDHDITMLQRSTGRFGARLGKSTGWIHRHELAEAGVRQIAGVAYHRIDDDGVHITRDGEAALIAADTVILCAGQEPNDPLSAGLRNKGMTVHVVGGARDAAGLDAKRAIAEGFDLALAL